MKIQIGTRKSKLALWQAYYVQDQLHKAGVDTEIITMETKGDKILDTSIAKIGSKGVFTEELEEQLSNGGIDIAVHSAKDMPSVLPDSFELIAFTDREKSEDVLVSHNPNLTLEDQTKKTIIGTSSVRRRALLKLYYPHVETVDIRGNLQTRIKKMKDGLCDGIMLAYAGVHRMNMESLIVQKFPVNKFVPPVGQGCVAIEAAGTLPIEKGKSSVPASIIRTVRSACWRNGPFCAASKGAVLSRPSPWLLWTGIQFPLPEVWSVWMAKKISLPTEPGPGLKRKQLAKIWVRSFSVPAAKNCWLRSEVNRIK